MTGKEFAETLRAGKRVYGTLIVSTSPRWPVAAKNGTADFVFIDTEHIPIDRAQLSWMCQTYSSMGLPPVVRIPDPNPSLACQVLDGGACGLVAPYVESVEQVKELVGAVKYRPLKGKRLQEAVENPDALDPGLRQYLKEYNAGNTLIVNIESVPAVENLDAILAVPGLDAVLIGPHDLTVSLDIPEQYQHPVFEETVRDVITRARGMDVAAGVHFWENTSQPVDWARLGANLMVHSGDITLFEQALRNDLSTMRAELGDLSGDTDAQGTTIV